MICRKNYARNRMSVHGLDQVRKRLLVDVDAPRQIRRLSVKPGLTCLWQISGRNQVRDFRDWVKLDLDYIDRWSLALDFKILLRTVPAVILGLGAK